MTCKEKFLKEHPEHDDDSVIYDACPDEEGYIPCKKCKCVTSATRIRHQTLLKPSKDICEACWNQPVRKPVATTIVFIVLMLAFIFSATYLGIRMYDHFNNEPDVTIEEPVAVETTGAVETSVDKSTLVDIPYKETTVEETVVEEPVTDLVTDVVEIPVAPTYEYFDVPLSEDLQDHIFELCEQYWVDPLMVVSVIKKESEFTPGAIGDNGNSFGLMQIQPRWHSERMARLGCTDLLDPYQNIMVGIDILAEIQKINSSLDWVLIAYNEGYGNADSRTATGNISIYAKTVKHYMNIIERK